MEMVQIFNRGLYMAKEGAPRIAPDRIVDVGIDYHLNEHEKREWRIGYDAFAMGNRKSRNRRGAGSVEAPGVNLLAEMQARGLR